MSLCYKTHLKLAIVGFLTIVANAPASVILIHFGGAALPDSGWNSITNAIGEVGSPLALVDSSNAATGISITLQNQFRGNNDAGYLGGDVGDFIAAAASTSLFGDNVSPWNQQSLLISGLSTGLSYTFEIFASRHSVDPLTDNRSGLYTFTGANSGFDELNASSNTSNLAIIDGIQPNASGNILFEITAGPSNNNGSSFYYINAMKITAIPEPGTTALLMGVLATGFIFYRRLRRAC